MMHYLIAENVITGESLILTFDDDKQRLFDLLDEQGLEFDEDDIPDEWVLKIETCIGKESFFEFLDWRDWVSED